MKKLLFALMGMGAMAIVLISSNVDPVNTALASGAPDCVGDPCEDANGLVYNTRNPLFGPKICCGKADDDRGHQAGS
jgi:hypothetical protein